MATKLIGKRADRARKRYFTILKYQSLILIVLVGLLALYDWVIAYSSALAGAVYLLPAAYFAHKHFSLKGGKSAQATLAELYAGQIWKMALMAVGYALIFVWVEPLSVFSLFATLILLQLVNMVMQFGAKENS